MHVKIYGGKEQANSKIGLLGEEPYPVPVKKMPRSSENIAEDKEKSR